MRRWALPACFLIIAAALALRDGFTWDGLLSFGKGLIFVAVLALAMWFAGEAKRPQRTYYLLTVFSGVIAMFFFLLPATEGVAGWIGVTAWAAVTMFGLIWCIYYERTEPLR